MFNHKDLEAWKLTMSLAEEIYLVTSKFPKQEMFGLIGQMRRAAVSIASNVAEGTAGQSRPEFIRFLYMPTGAVSELDTQIEISGRVGLLIAEDTSRLQDRVERISKLLYGLIRSLKKCG